ncbi:MAG: hypothetical protein WD768_16310 [Phycisphaeraceae bacterium]
MDKTETGNKASGNAADDLWKKVLKDVSTEAAHRRQKIAARTVSAVAKVAPGDSELLKRVLLALEAKPNGEHNAQLEGLLKKVLDAVVALPREVPDHGGQLKDVDRHLKDLSRNLGEFLRKRDDKPALEPKEIVDPLLDALQKSGASQSETIAKAIADAATSQREAGERQANLLGELTKQIASLPQSPDLRPQLDALKQTIEALQSAAARQSQAVMQEVARILSEQPKPADHGEQLKQLQDQVAAVAAEVSKPAPPVPEAAPSVDPAKVDELLVKVQAIADRPSADPTKALKEIRDSVAALAAAQAPPLDPAKLDELHASVKQLAESPAIDAVRELRGEIEQLREATQQPALAEKLDAIAAALAALPKADFSGQFDELLQAVRADRDTPQALTDKLNEIVRKLGEKPDDGRDIVLLQILETVQAIQAAPNEQPQPTVAPVNSEEISEKVGQRVSEKVSEKVSEQIGERFDQLLDRMSKLEQSHGSTAGASAGTEAKLDQIAARLNAHKPPADEAMLARLFGEVKQPLADQQALLRQLLDDQGQRDEKQSQRFQQVLDKLDAATSQRADATEFPIGDVRGELTRILEALNKQVRTDPGPVLLKVLDKLDGLARGTTDRDILTQIRASLAAPSTQVEEALAKIQEAVTRPTDDSQRKVLEQVLAAVQELAAVPAPQVPDVAAIAEPIRAELSASAQQSREDFAAAAGQLQQEIQGRLDSVERKVTEQTAAVTNQMQAQTAALRDELLLATTQDDQQIQAGIASLRTTLKDQIAQLRDELSAVATSMPAPSSGLDEAALRPVIAAIEALPRDDGRSGAEQRGMLQELMSLVKAMRDQVSREPKPSDASPKVLDQLSSLGEANRQTQKTLQRIVELLNSRPASEPLSISAASVSEDSGSSTPRYTPSYRGRPSWGERLSGSSRSTRVALVVAACALVGIFGLMLINLFRGPGDGNTNPQGNPNAIAAGPGPVLPNPNQANISGANTGVQPTKDKGDTKAGTNTGVNTPATTFVGPDGQVRLFPEPVPPDPNDTKVHRPLLAEIGKFATDDDKGKPVKLPLLEMPDAGTIVFLVHASGDSGAAKLTIVNELKRQLAAIDPKQKFTILLAEGIHFVEVPPNGLKAGTEAERRKAEVWIDLNLRGGLGRAATSPLVALDMAMEYEPDLLWIVTDGIAGDKPGQVKPAEFIKRVQTLNKNNKVHVAGTQIGANDPANTLKILSEQFGGRFENLSQAETSSRGE